jgi:6-pyruvoyltetrahydropterin/6-carboxytetrahydropterin synthase
LRFSASHRLTHLAEGHPCARLHGHNYLVEVELESALLNGDSFIRDYNELKPFQQWIDTTLDHRHICGIVDGDVAPQFILANTPAEVMAVEQEQLTVVREGGLSTMQPATAENIARALLRICRLHWPEAVAVRVSETPKTWAEYR